MPPAVLSVAEAVLADVDPARFSDVHFDWRPYPYQREVMDAVLLHGARRIAWVAGRRVGKTETTAAIALQLAVKKPGTQVAIFAPSFRQACFMSQSIKHMLQGSIFEDNVVVDRMDELRFRFGVNERGKNVESVIYTNSLEGKVRGQGANVLIVDESAFCDSTEYTTKVLPIVANHADAIIIHISTIYHEDDHFMEVLRTYPLRPDGRKFVTPTRMNPSTHEMLKEMKASTPDAVYQREYECKLVPEGSVFDPRALRACTQDYPLHDLFTLAKLMPKRHHDYYVGVDWGKKQDRAVIAVVEQGTQEKTNPAKLVFLQVYEPDPDNPHHYTRVLDDVQRVAKQVGAKRVVADEGEGGHQAEVLQRALGKRFKSFRFSGKSRNWLVDHAQVLVERRGVVLPVEPDEVQRAFANVQPTENGYEHLSRQSKDVFDAIGLALHEVGEAGAVEERAPMRLFTASPGGRASLSGGPLPEIDPRRVFFPPEVWHLLR